MASSIKLLKTSPRKADSYIHQALADNVASLMKFRGWNQSKLAEKAGVGQRTVSNLLNPAAGISPNVRTLIAVAAALDTTPWLLLMPNMGNLDTRIAS